MDNPRPPSTLDTLIADATAHLRDFGGRVLPTIPAPAGPKRAANPKLPIRKGGCLSATDSVGDLPALFGQTDEYGLGLTATGYAYYPAQDIVVFDRDEKHGKSGKADTAHVAQQIGCPLPETATVRSPSGGDHLYFQLPPGLVLPKGLIGIVGRRPLDADGKPEMSGLDIFAHSADKSYWVAGPGTVTPKGSYTWLNDADVATLPQPWIDHIMTAKPPKPPRDPSQPRAERETVPLSYLTAVLACLDPIGLDRDTRFKVRAIILGSQVLDDATGQELAEEDAVSLVSVWGCDHPRFEADDTRTIRSILENLEDDTLVRAGLGSLHTLAMAHGYAGPAPSVALANATVHARFKGQATLSASASADAAKPPVLMPAAPMDSAREMLRREFMHDGSRTLVHDQGEFHLWNGRAYAPVSRDRMDARVARFLDGAFRKGKDGTLLPFNPVGKHVDELRRALAFQTHTPAGAEAPCWLDGRTDPRSDPKQLLAVSNGLLDLTTRELLPHTPAYFNANALEFAYDATATRPEWDRFLSQVFPDGQQVIDTLQEMFGLMLTADTSHQKAFMLIGPPRSGKGTIARILTAVLGSANVCAPKLADLGKDFGKQTLIGKRAAILGDAQLGSKADKDAIAETLLSITGQDTINIGRKYQGDWTGRLETCFVMMANELPKINNASGALVNRFIMLTTDESFLGREDHGLEARLMTELPGILNWSLDGLVRLRARGRFVQPQSSADAMLEMEHLGSPVKAFLHEMCDVGAEFTTATADLYQAYVGWCVTEGKRPIDARTFGKDLGAAVPGLRAAKVGGRGAQTRRYQGVGLRQPATATQAGDNVRYIRPGTRPTVVPPVPAPATRDDIVVPPATVARSDIPNRAQLRAEWLAKRQETLQ